MVVVVGSTALHTLMEREPHTQRRSKRRVLCLWRKHYPGDGGGT